MLNIFNNLAPFFEDVYRELGVRECARLMNISPPTASKLLKGLAKETLLIQKKERNLILFRANRENPAFKDLAKAYWTTKLSKELENLHSQTLYCKIILFGSISKIENTINSDIDIFIDASKKEIDTTELEKTLNRKIQLHFKEELNNEYLKENIEKGMKLW